MGGLYVDYHSWALGHMCHVADIFVEGHLPKMLNICISVFLVTLLVALNSYEVSICLSIHPYLSLSLSIYANVITSCCIIVMKLHYGDIIHYVMVINYITAVLNFMVTSYITIQELNYITVCVICYINVTT